MTFFNKIWKFIDKRESNFNLRTKFRRKSTNTGHVPSAATTVDVSSSETTPTETSLTVENNFYPPSTCVTLSRESHSSSEEVSPIEVLVRTAQVTRHVSVSRSGRYKQRQRRRSAMVIDFDHSRESGQPLICPQSTMVIDKKLPDNLHQNQTMTDDHEQDNSLLEIEVQFNETLVSVGSSCSTNSMSSDETTSQGSC